MKKKLPLSELIDEEKIPAFLDGVATDVIKGNLNLVNLGDVLKTQLEEAPCRSRLLAWHDHHHDDP